MRNLLSWVRYLTFLGLFLMFKRAGGLVDIKVLLTKGFFYRDRTHVSITLVVFGLTVFKYYDS